MKILLKFLNTSTNKLQVKKHIIIILFLLIGNSVFAQVKTTKNPKRAAIYSAIIPGTGQVYTKKYWKIPIIYGGLITSGYYINESNNLYQLYKSTYINRINGDMSDNLNYSNTDLRTLTEHHRRNREISALLFTLTYVLNIVDASVNAHLFNYDISDDLTLNIQPIYFSKENASGISLSFNL